MLLIRALGRERRKASFLSGAGASKASARLLFKGVDRCLGFRKIPPFRLKIIFASGYGWQSLKSAGFLQCRRKGGLQQTFKVFYGTGSFPVKGKPGYPKQTADYTYRNLVDIAQQQQFLFLPG